MSIVIKAENISKQYRLGQVGRKTIAADFKRWIYKLQGKEDPFAKIGEVNDRSQKGNSEYVWALHDINFEVKQGEVLGIIGKNGAGKSTLLKILSRVTTPTTGKIGIQGRMASLLEVGTGFHPELTGRENVFLNGAIMGMSKTEIKSKFDEIVEFSGVERYIDTPVKRYSSGMYVRLGFAVAAHLEPEILVVDEVLAVGDSEFQKKCLGKMKSVSSEGRTVLFVSHNLAAVKSLCTSGIVLSNGELVFSGNQSEAINYYQDKTSNSIASSYFGKTVGNDNILIHSFNVLPVDTNIISISSGFLFELVFYNSQQNINLDATFELKSVDEIVVFHHGKIITSENNSKKGIYTVQGLFPSNILNSGVYSFNIIFGKNQSEVLFMISDILKFEVLNEAMGANLKVLPGIIRPQIDYTINFKSTSNE